MSSISDIRGGFSFKVPLEYRHRAWLALGGLASASLISALAVNGFHYYLLPLAQRVRSAQHVILRPSGTVGEGLGILAFLMFGIMFLYPLRKRWRFLATWGTTKHWLDYHILLGITAPLLICFHASFKMRGIAGAAFWIMVTVALSGVVGRYMYSAIPRRLDEAEMSMDELKQLSQNIAAQLERQEILTAEELRPLFDLPSPDKVKALPVWRCLIMLLGLDFRRSLLLSKLRRRSRALGKDPAEIDRVLALARQQASLSKSILCLSQIQRIFNLWHVFHRPFSYSFAALALLHLVVVAFYGFV